MENVNAFDLSGQALLKGIEDKKKLGEIMEEWKKEAHIPSYEETIAVHMHGSTISIVTQRPGYFIGKAGSLIKKYQNILQEKGLPSDIEFVDIFCGNVKIF